MSYDLRLVREGPLDVDAVRRALLSVDGVQAEGDELVWPREALVAQFLVVPAELDVGVVTTGGGNDECATREFRELLELLFDLADRLDARLEDEQLGRELTRADVDEAAAGFA